MPPILSPQRVAEAVVDRHCGFTGSDEAALYTLLIAIHPTSARLARRYERRLAVLLSQMEDPVTQLERLTGRAWTPCVHPTPPTPDSSVESHASAGRQGRG
ncbi:MAG: hypothetical protein ABJF88_05685 [Rhodothermales bacterium]